MKVLILTQYFQPEFAVIPNELANFLYEKGHEVKVLTTFPNYPAGIVFPGYKQSRFFIEEIDGVQVRRVPMYINRSRNPLKRIISYLSFGLSASTAFRFAKNADVIYIYATQLTPAIAPQVWGFRKKIPFVLHIQDLWPDSVTGSGLVSSNAIMKAITQLLNIWINTVYKAAASIITIAPTMSEILQSRSVPKNKLQSIYNWADEELEAQRHHENHNLISHFDVHREKTRFVYSGNLGEMQALDTLIKAISKMKNRNTSHFYFVGSGSLEKQLMQLASSLGITNISFLGRVEPPDMITIYSSSDFQLVTLKNLPIFNGTIPSKFQGALSNGIPVVSAVNGDVNKLVRDNKIGFTANAEDVVSLVTALDEAASLDPSKRKVMGRNALKFYRENMSQSRSLAAIESILVEASESNNSGEKS